MQFQQPDTLVPDPYNPLDWNRYAYVRNNPVNFIDPTGHMQDVPDDGGVTPDVVEKEIAKYDWTVGDGFNLPELFKIWDAAITLRLYLNDIRGKDDLPWMKKYFGGINFTIGKFITGMLGSSVTPDENTIHLISNFETIPWEQGTVGHILHEVGHILDNRLANNIERYKAGIPPLSAVFIGGGPSDALYEFMGGKYTNMFRYQGGVSFANPSNAFVQYPYGNNSPADYFAHTFAISMVRYDAVPSQAALWMSSFLTLLP